MRTGNPALNASVFQFESANVHAMTLPGTAVKSAGLLALCIGAAAVSWNQAAANPDLARTLVMLGAIGGLITALITVFKPTVSPFTAPIYAVAEGLVLGTISLMFNTAYTGIVFQAVGLTFGVFASLLFCYSTGVIRATENFKLGVVAATGGIFLIYFVSFVMSFFGSTIPYIHESGLIGIGFSLFVVVIAALNLVLDFDFIEKGVEHGAPKYMEWYAAFGLLVTLVWLYMEVLRLLAKVQSRD
jgi:uncharacterized YccA/Bax inhibitor family protein